MARVEEICEDDFCLRIYKTETRGGNCVFMTCMDVFTIGLYGQLF